MAKRKRTIATAVNGSSSSTTGVPGPPSAPPMPRRVSGRTARSRTDPNVNPEIVDAPNALRASPDAEVNLKLVSSMVKDEEDSDSPLSEVPPVVEPPKKKGRGMNGHKKAVAGDQGRGGTKPEETAARATKAKDESVAAGDPEADGEEEADEEELKEALGRPPPVNSPYLPLPWKGRIGYACLNTYLRYSNPPVFSSRTCRIASIIEHRHPLKDPSQPEHPTKNRPDKDQPADIERGKRYVESIGLANAQDIIKMVRWNDRYGIKFLRLSSEMFPFASHEEYGYKLAPFAADILAAAGKVIAELGHRVSTHPGQFTQLGSPRKQVIDNAIRDLEYHDEMLSLLKLPPQENRDAVMILHLGGVFGDKAATLDRFRENYARLSASIKNRLVLENDDVSWSVHDLLPLCEELNIPLVLDYHHHNIIFDSTQLREGTLDIMQLYDRITATWRRKNIKQKMHYSEPTPAAITGRQRRKHSPRVATLPPCAPDMDLMIEAKDKEQAVFELMRIFKLPGFDTFADMVPHARADDNKPVKLPPKKKTATPKKKASVADVDEELAEVAEPDRAPVPEEEVGMGGPDGRVYWPPGMEDWLRPKKREIKKKDPASATTTPAKRKKATAAAAATLVAKQEGDGAKMPKASAAAAAATTTAGQSTPLRGGAAAKRRSRTAKAVPTPTPTSGDDEDGDEMAGMSDVGSEETEEGALDAKGVRRKAAGRARQSARARGRRGVNYREDDASE